jgi:dTDP-L-rhamnose 4-epimerase
MLPVPLNLAATADLAGGSLTPEIVGRFREGDIRACYADVTKARDVLGFSSRVTLDQGVKELVSLVAGQSSVDRSRKAFEELEQHRLIR